MYKSAKLNSLSNRLGFTLIEILVSMGILAILMSIVLISINPNRQLMVASDTRRKADVQYLHNALVQYFIDNRCLPTETEWDNLVCGVTVPDKLKPYMADFPCDPDTKLKYYYEPLDKDCRPCNGGCGVCVGFRLMGTLKNKNDQSIVINGCNPDSGCGITDAHGQILNYGNSFSCPVKPPLPSPSVTGGAVPSPTDYLTPSPVMPTATDMPVPTPSPTATPTSTPTLTPTPPSVAYCSDYISEGSWGYLMWSNSVNTFLYVNDPQGFMNPKGMAYDKTNGFIYITNWNGWEIHKYSSDMTLISKWLMPGNPKDLERRPSGIAIDSLGYVYAVDNWNHRVLKFDGNGNLIFMFGSNGTGNGQFNMPDRIPIDSSDNLYITDRWNYRIQKFTSTGTFLTKWGNQGNGAGQFDYPAGIVVDRTGTILVTDTNNNRIQEFDQNGTFIRDWGTTGNVGTDVAKVGLFPGQFLYPVDISVDDSGNIFVIDSLNHRIQKFDGNRVFVTMWGLWGNGISTQDHPEYINTPQGVMIDPSYNVYVSDTGHGRIAKFICR